MKIRQTKFAMTQTQEVVPKQKEDRKLKTSTTNKSLQRAGLSGFAVAIAARAICTIDTRREDEQRFKYTIQCAKARLRCELTVHAVARRIGGCPKPAFGWE